MLLTLSLPLLFRLPVIEQIPEETHLQVQDENHDIGNDEVVTVNDFEENVVDQCICMKVSGCSFIFLVLYVDNILLASNDIDLLVFRMSSSWTSSLACSF